MLTALPPRTYANLIGKPFREDGRGPDAFDCLGLAIEILRRNGFDVPEYASTPEELARQQTEGALGPCTKIERAVPGAVVLMRSSRAARVVHCVPAGISDVVCETRIVPPTMGEDYRHLGVMVDRFRMIHASEPAGAVVIETLSRSFWGRRVLGYYFPEVRG